MQDVDIWRRLAGGASPGHRGLASPRLHALCAAPGLRRLLVLFALAAIPSVLAVVQLGSIHPDEVHQFLQPAYRLAHGYGDLPWEWRDGLRNWAIPGALGGALAICDSLGIHHPIACRAVLALPLAVLHGWVLVSIHRFAARRVGDARGLLAVILAGCTSIIMVYAGRTTSETFGTAFFVIAAEVLDRSECRKRAAFGAGVLLGLSVVARYGSVVLVLAALAWLAVRCDWRRLALVCAGGVVVAVGLGALDWATWGRPFHSIVEYTRFNVLTDGAEKAFGRSSSSFYLVVLLRDTPPWVWIGTFMAVWRKRAPLPVIAALAYFAAISVTPHKEDRFVYPATVLLVMASAPDLADLAGRLFARRPRVACCCVALALVAGLGFFGRLSLRVDEYHAMVRAARGDEVTGLLMLNESWTDGGGYFFVGKRIFLQSCPKIATASCASALGNRLFNRVVTHDGAYEDKLQKAGFVIGERVGRASIFVRDGGTGGRHEPHGAPH